MKLTTLVAAGAAIAGAAVAFSATTASAAQVYENYSYSFPADSAQLYVTNNSAQTYTNVTIDGNNLGSLAPGASTGPLDVGDPGEGSASSATISFSIGAHTGTFSVPVYDYDYTTSGNLVGASNAVPEPATWSLMLLAMAGVGGAMRSRRRMATATA
ncbi:MAG: PEP-CTERM sorting domain-containing protein [Caulobacteraceae bacterium]|nr:PEP-CTERM sorting domain-containing protein [Caulobacteraceae bacterium]